MSLQATVEALPGRITEAIKTLFASERTELATVSNQLVQLQADLGTARQSIATLTQERDTAQDNLKVSAAALETLQQSRACEEAEQPAKIAAAASAKAAEINAGLGVPALPIKTDAAPVGPAKPLLQQHAEIKDPQARAEFWAKHRKEILGE